MELQVRLSPHYPFLFRTPGPFKLPVYGSKRTPLWGFFLLQFAFVYERISVHSIRNGRTSVVGS